jgi:hypothetical protein
MAQNEEINDNGSQKHFISSTTIQQQTRHEYTFGVPQLLARGFFKIGPRRSFA